MAKALIINSAGDILRQLSGDPTMFALQAGAGEEVYAVTETTDSGVINDTEVMVDTLGELAARPGVTLSSSLPDMILELIP